MCFYYVTQLLSLIPNSITYESDTSDRKLGNGERVNNLGRGELTFEPGLFGRYLQEGSKGVFWGFRSTASPIDKWSSSLDLEGSTCCKCNKCQMKLTSDHWCPRPCLPPQPVRIQVWNDSQFWERRRFFTKRMLNFDNGSSKFFTSSWPWILLIKPPTLGGNGIWNLRFFRLDWKFQRSCWKKEEDGGLGVGKMSVSPS